MTVKTAVTLCLVLFAAASVGYVIVDEMRAKNDSAPGPESPGPSAAEAPSGPTTVIAYYFHGNVRCVTCRTIEKYTHEALTSAFPDKLAASQLEWRIVNIDLPENEHFTEDYQLASSSVVLVSQKGGQQVTWTTLDRVWELVDDEVAFKKYVEEGAKAYLEG